jgi:predicted RNA-binding Zn-ribbon protein involved in translation (DUF1610 family)
MFGNSHYDEIDHLPPTMRQRVYQHTRTRSRNRWQFWAFKLIYIATLIVFSVAIGIFQPALFLFAILFGTVVIALIAIFIDERMTRKIMRRAIDEHLGLLCSQCGYDLRGSYKAGRHHCPECGAFNNPNEIPSPPCLYCGCDLTIAVKSGVDECPACGRAFNVGAVRSAMNEASRDMMQR